MHFDTKLHDYLKNTNEYYCHFCIKQLNEYVKQETESCGNKNGGNEPVCYNSGQVNGYQIGKKYFDFQENMYKITNGTRSVYHRKYHFENTIADICSKYFNDLSPSEKQKILKVF